MKNNIKKTSKMIDIFAVNCTKCGKEITGSSEASVIYNVRIHQDAKHVKIKGEAQADARASEDKAPRPSRSSTETKSNDTP